MRSVPMHAITEEAAAAGIPTPGLAALDDLNQRVVPVRVENVEALGRAGSITVLLWMHPGGC